MNKVRALILSIVTALAMVFPTTISAHAASSITLINTGYSYGEHHVYAYSGTGCNGTRWKLEKGMRQSGVRSFKSPWSLRFEEPLGGSWNLAAARCLTDAGRYVRSSSNNIYVIINRY